MLYLRNDTRQGSSYYGIGMPIGTNMRSIELCLFHWPLMTHNHYLTLTISEMV